ncbi:MULTISPECIES: bifunctional riboflavin kinase/FAD synthetase [unclassified Streptococcus]|uniref:bifunctional riboflavin kinase/FAD synthetase n=1 Tax=unclassified Streptococcus TaxID=2608887 RepID=UPI00359ECC86
MDIFRLKTDQELIVDEPVVLVLGYFDALHCGHKKLFEEARAIAQARQLKVAVLTFYESPKLAFARFTPDLLLHVTYPEKRYAKFAEYGVDQLYLMDFTSDFARTSSAEFISRYIEGLQAKVVVVGFDYHFGHDKRPADDLKTAASCEVVIVPELQDDGEKISSTRIRRAISKGHIETTNRLLGYEFSTRGIVVHGDARGRTMGFPTANLAPIDRTFLPADGVYVADILVKGNRYRSMTSVGKNVTFDGQDLRLEAHLFDFDEDIYGETIEILWLSKIRDMIKFDSVEKLVEQLEFDKKISKNWEKV